MKFIAILVGCVLLCGCGVTQRMTTYEASVTAQGREYTLCNKHGAYLVVEEADGTKIIADDRGYAEEPGLLSQAMQFGAMKAVTAD